MKVAFFIDWENREVMTEEGAKKHLEETKADTDNFNDYVGEWLEEEIDDFLRGKNMPRDFSTVFQLSQKYRDEILANLRKSYERSVENDFETDWEKFEFEV